MGEEIFTQTADPIQLGQKFLEELDIYEFCHKGLTLPQKLVFETEVKREFDNSYIDQQIFDNVYNVVRNFKENVFGIIEEDIEKDAEQLEM